MQYTVALFSGKPLDISSTLLNVLGTPHPTPTHPGHPVVGYYIYIFLLVPSALHVSTTMLFVKLGSAMTHELLFMRGVARDLTENVHEIKSRCRRRVKCPAYHNVLAVVCGVIQNVAIPPPFITLEFEL